MNIFSCKLNCPICPEAGVLLFLCYFLVFLYYRHCNYFCNLPEYRSFYFTNVSTKLLHEHSLEFIVGYSLCQAVPSFLFYTLVLKFNLYRYHYHEPYVFKISSFVPPQRGHVQISTQTYTNTTCVSLSLAANHFILTFNYILLIITLIL